MYSLFIYLLPKKIFYSRLSTKLFNFNSWSNPSLIRFPDGGDGGAGSLIEEVEELIKETKHDLQQHRRRPIWFKPCYFLVFRKLKNHCFFGFNGLFGFYAFTIKTKETKSKLSIVRNPFKIIYLFIYCEPKNIFL